MRRAPASKRRRRRAELGFAVGGGEVAGALVSAGITEDDIASGLYDDASVETWLVNWSNVAERVLLDIGSIGEIRRADGSFVAEVRGLDAPPRRGARAALSRHLLGRSRRRALRHQSRLVDLFATRARSRAPTARWPSPPPASALRTGGALRGKLTWTSGANAGISVEIKVHRAVGGTDEFDLWQRAPQPIVVGDTFRVTAGCDKTHATCRKKFANVVNFRGFPHMPGNDFIIRMPQQGEPGLDGGSFFQVRRTLASSGECELAAR